VSTRESGWQLGPMDSELTGPSQPIGMCKHTSIAMGAFGKVAMAFGELLVIRTDQPSLPPQMAAISMGPANMRWLTSSRAGICNPLA